MSKIKIHGGDFLAGDSQYTSGNLFLKTKRHSFVGEKMKVSELIVVDIATEESVKRVGGTLGWSIVGILAFGGLGLAAGLFFGGRGKDVTFVAELKDGRKFYATTDGKTFNILKGAAFTNAEMTVRLNAP